MINCWDALEVMQTNSPLNESTPAPDSPAVASAPALPLKTGPILKIFGVGGAGCNALAHIARAGIDGVECVAMNTDAAALERCPVANKLSLGTKLTRGLGAGGDPDRGRAAAEEDRERLRPMCEGMDVLFVVAGLGGGTGTGAAPVLAQMAKESGALVIGMVVLPFDWEGERRQRQAELGLRQLKAAADAVVCLPNQKLRTMVADKTSVLEGFAIANDVLAQGLRGVWRLLTRPGLINVDFADVCTVTRDRHSECTLATAEAQGEHRVKEVLEKLFKHPLMEEGAILGDSAAVLVSLAGGPDLTLDDVNGVMEQIHRHCETAHIITGAAIEESLAGRLAVTVVSARRGPTERSSEAEAIAATEMLPEPAFGKREPESRTSSRFVAPPPTITPDNLQQLTAHASPRQRKQIEKMQQGTLDLRIVSKGRFDKSHPTIWRGEDLDEPTYLRRNLALN